MLLGLTFCEIHLHSSFELAVKSNRKNVTEILMRLKILEASTHINLWIWVFMPGPKRIIFLEVKRTLQLTFFHMKSVSIELVKLPTLLEFLMYSAGLNIKAMYAVRTTHISVSVVFV
jgi:hypothetical protein